MLKSFAFIDESKQNSLEENASSEEPSKHFAFIMKWSFFIGSSKKQQMLKSLHFWGKQKAWEEFASTNYSKKLLH